MKYSTVPTAVLVGVLGVLVPLGSLCSAAEPSTPPSKVDNPVPEAALPTVHLTPQAIARLDIATTKVERKRRPHRSVLPGIVRLPLGDAADPLAPAPVSGPEELRKLAELQATADGAVASARVSLAATEQARKRAETLNTERAGSGRALDESRAAEALAKVSLDTTMRSRALLGGPATEMSASARRWIAVSLPASALARVDPARTAQVRPFGTLSSKVLPAEPVQRPSTGLPSGNVEVFFEVADPSLTLGQQVEVEIPDRDDGVGPDPEPSLVVPWSAIVFDATGGAWVYEQKTNESFSRRRVSVSRVAGNDAFLAAGPPEGTMVVSVGVAELYGTEFGGFK